MHDFWTDSEKKMNEWKEIERNRIQKKRKKVTEKRQRKESKCTWMPF